MSSNHPVPLRRLSQINWQHFTNTDPTSLADCSPPTQPMVTDVTRFVSAFKPVVSQRADELSGEDDSTDAGMGSPRNPRRGGVDVARAPATSSSGTADALPLRQPSQIDWLHFTNTHPTSLADCSPAIRSSVTDVNRYVPAFEPAVAERADEPLEEEESTSPGMGRSREGRRGGVYIARARTASSDTANAMRSTPTRDRQVSEARNRTTVQNPGLSASSSRLTTRVSAPESAQHPEFGGMLEAWWANPDRDLTQLWPPESLEQPRPASQLPRLVGSQVSRRASIARATREALQACDGVSRVDFAVARSARQSFRRDSFAEASTEMLEACDGSLLLSAAVETQQQQRPTHRIPRKPVHPPAPVSSEWSGRDPGGGAEETTAAATASGSETKHDSRVWFVTTGPETYGDRHDSHTNLTSAPVPQAEQSQAKPMPTQAPTLEPGSGSESVAKAGSDTRSRSSVLKQKGYQAGSSKKPVAKSRFVEELDLEAPVRRPSFSDARRDYARPGEEETGS